LWILEVLFIRIVGCILFLGEGDRLLDVWEALFDSSDSRILFNGEVI